MLWIIKWPILVEITSQPQHMIFLQKAINGYLKFLNDSFSDIVFYSECVYIKSGHCLWNYQEKSVLNQYFKHWCPIGIIKHKTAPVVSSATKLSQWYHQPKKCPSGIISQTTVPVVSSATKLSQWYHQPQNCLSGIISHKTALLVS